MYLLSIQLYLVDEEKKKDLTALRKSIVEQLGVRLHEMGYSKSTPERPTVEVVVVDVTSNRNYAVLKNLSVVDEAQLGVLFETLNCSFMDSIKSTVEIEYVGSVKRYA